MSEILNSSNENHELKASSPENEPAPVNIESRSSIDKTSNDETINNEDILREASKKVEQEAISGKEYTVGEKSETRNHPVVIGSQLKNMAYSRGMMRTRKQLSPISRTFSRITHSKIMDKPSEILGNTIARPSGILGGALVSLFGTSLLLWISRNYGYEYNYLAVTVLFATGLVLGISLEVLIKLLRKR